MRVWKVSAGVDHFVDHKNARRISPPGVSPSWQKYQQKPVETANQAFCRPHHSAMNSAVDWVILRIDSMFTRSSKPWTSSDCGP
jgi:hypothetical protein